MEKRRTFLPLVLALVLCLSLAACGDDGGGSDDDVTEVPEAFEGLVKDTAQLTANYAMYRGVWLGDGGTLEGGSGGLYQAPSVVYDGVVYDMTVVSGDTLYWGGENDCYQKLT